MAKVLVGDVVLTPFPFTDLSDIKIRPAVVVADVGMQDWVLCQITSRAPTGKLHIAIGPNDMEGGLLRLRSWVRPDRLYTVNDGVFQKTLGQLSSTKMAEVRAAVRSLF